MPFSGPDDKSLPRNVKKLGDKQRRQWVKVFNSAHARCEKKGGEDCEAVAFKSANGVLKNASYASLLGGESPLGRSFIEFSAGEPPETINVFPSPGTFKHPVWGDVEVTKEGNQLFVDNFNAHVYQEHVPIDAEHETQLSGAMGYLKSLSLNEDDSIEASVEWTERGQKLIEDDSFKYISPAWFEQWKDPATDEEFENVMIGAALTTRPFFKDQALRSLVASEGRLFDVEEDGPREPVVRSAIEGVSYDDLRGMILSAARHEFPGVVGTHEYSGWVADLYDDHVIIEGGSKYWHLDYSYEDSAVKFSGQPKEVQRRSFWEDVPPHHAKEDDEDRIDHTHTNPDPNKRKEKSMTQPDVEQMASEAEKLEEKERLPFLQRLATTFGISVKVDGGDDKDEDDKDEEDTDDPAPDPKAATEITTLSTALDTERKAREDADKRVGVLEASGRAQRFRDIVLGRDDDGVRVAKEDGATPLHPMVGEFTQKMQIMERLGEGTDEFKAYVASERESAARLHAAGTFSEVGLDSHDGGVSSSAKAEMEKRITAEMSGDNPVKTREEAIAKIATDDPTLMNAYDQEVTKREQPYRATG